MWTEDSKNLSADSTEEVSGFLIQMFRLTKYSFVWGAKAILFLEEKTKNKTHLDISGKCVSHPCVQHRMCELFTFWELRCVSILVYVVWIFFDLIICINIKFWKSNKNYMFCIILQTQFLVCNWTYQMFPNIFKLWFFCHSPFVPYFEMRFLFRSK